ncbi:MAG: phycobilisome rod-core linker polypeptide [Crocosphaera sp.]|uniref:phycobilisome rod-core linker polypeptide n=1 Tax=Crocosphaera sp. TaxID=2729996 RepID=UPI00258CB61A|nr:phycobilisome rod-core linker polypeptide [Crocosphaera sp.]MCH2248080.1 phycobilisome rod-core linker polypeptide [Crocosphaera sp.]
MTSLTGRFITDPVELRPNGTEDDLQIVIRSVYRQLLGNAHLLESQRLDSAESMLRNGDITVRGFVRMVAQSELYKSLFFDASPTYRFIELNYKHFLGRAPLNQAEIAQHVQTYNEQGYAAEIDSYLDSDDYILQFGENIVPYPYCLNTKTGMTTNVFNRTVSLVGGFATSDVNSNQAQLIASIASNLAQKINVAVSTGGISGSTNKRFRIAVTKAGITPVTKRSNQTYEVGYSQLSAKIQNIHKTGGKIVSITEVI